MVLMTSKTSLQKWSGVFFPSVSPVFFQIGTVTYQHRLRFRWRGFMYEFLPLIRKARTRCDLCRALHDFARLRLTSQCLPAGNYGWRKCIQRGCFQRQLLISAIRFLKLSRFLNPKQLRFRLLILRFIPSTRPLEKSYSTLLRTAVMFFFKVEIAMSMF